MWNQTMPTWLGVDFPTTFFCPGNNGDWRKEHLTIHFVVRSLPVEDGGSQYELIAIATDVEQNVNEGNDGIEHMYDNWMTEKKHLILVLSQDVRPQRPECSSWRKTIWVPLWQKNRLWHSWKGQNLGVTFSFTHCWIKPYQSFSSVSNSKVRIIFLAGIMPNKIIGSVFTKPTTTTTTKTKPTSNQTGCKTRVATKQVKHQKSGIMYKVWWCRKASGRMKIVKFQKVVTR